MFDTKNDLPVNTRTKVIELLNARLADAIDLGTQTKHAHWNVKRRFMQSVLDDAAIVEGEPSMLVLTISTRIGSPRQDDAAHIALTLAAGAAALAGYHSHGPAKNAPRRMEIPIPRGCEEEARALAKSLQSAGPANSDILHI